MYCYDVDGINPFNPLFYFCIAALFIQSALLGVLVSVGA
jgi:hypothetical protein